jgi:hypothetical protein
MVTNVLSDTISNKHYETIQMAIVFPMENESILQYQPYMKYFSQYKWKKLELIGLENEYWSRYTPTIDTYSIRIFKNKKEINTYLKETRNDWNLVMDVGSLQNTDFMKQMNDLYRNTQIDVIYWIYEDRFFYKAIDPAKVKQVVYPMYEVKELYKGSKDWNSKWHETWNQVKVHSIQKLFMNPNELAKKNVTFMSEKVLFGVSTDTIEWKKSIQILKESIWNKHSIQLHCIVTRSEEMIEKSSSNYEMIYQINMNNFYNLLQKVQQIYVIPGMTLPDELKYMCSLYNVEIVYVKIDGDKIDCTTVMEKDTEMNVTKKWEKEREKKLCLSFI